MIHIGLSSFQSSCFIQSNPEEKAIARHADMLCQIEISSDKSKEKRTCRFWRHVLYIVLSVLSAPGKRFVTQFHCPVDAHLQFLSLTYQKTWNIAVHR